MKSIRAIKGRNSKVVSGSQYRHLSRDQQSKCEQCEQFDKMVKKLRETIRALRFKLERFEDKYNDLKLFKSNTTSADGNGSNVKLVHHGRQDKLFFKIIYIFFACIVIFRLGALRSVGKCREELRIL